MSNESASIQSCMLSDEDLNSYVQSVIEQMPEKDLFCNTLKKKLPRINKAAISNFIKSIFNKNSKNKGRNDQAPRQNEGT